MFHVGQKVVCINECPPTVPGKWNLPSVGAIYTIRGIFPYADGRLGLLFEEIVNRKNGAYEPHFNAARFRPLIERKTSTGFAILEEIRKRESVPADEKPRVKKSEPAGQRHD